MIVTVTAIATLLFIYIVGVIALIVTHFKMTRWYRWGYNTSDADRTPRSPRWVFTWWGRPIAVLTDAVMWPYSIYKELSR